MALIYHIAARADWERAMAEGAYRPASLEREGFIHLSSAAQLRGVAERLYQGRDDLLLLAVDPSLLQAELRYEEGEPGEQFPHLYGPLNLDAVETVFDILPDQTGGFSMPAGS